MSPMQQIFLGLGAGAKKTYVDDVFSTYVYTGDDASGRTVTNGIDLSNEGGMVWIKNREQAENHAVFDTARGTGKKIETNNSDQEQSGTSWLSAFNSNGFTVGGSAQVNKLNIGMSSWTFRKAPGFFDVVTYTGSGSAKTVSHSLGCIPGMIIVKNLDTGEHWTVQHRSIGPTKYGNLSTTGQFNDSDSRWNDTAPTSTNFTVGSDDSTNKSGDSFVAYVFAGGESTAATACSVSFDGSNDYLYTSTSHSDVSFGTGNFTIELWFRYNGSDLASTNDTLIDTRNGDSGGNSDYGWTLFVRTNGHLALYTNGSDGDGYAVESNTVLSVGQWYHAAITREGNTYRLFLNGVLDDTNTQSSSADAGSNFYIGYKANYAGSSLTYWNGLISNVRILKGTALYTSSFRPPTEPLTNITNTKFLWAQSSTVTTGTVNPMTLTNSGTTASTDSPFDDPAGYVFGENEDQNVIKCGSYKTDSNEDAILDLGWEPQWVLAKRTDSSTGGDWMLYDSMRGLSNRQDVLAESGVSSALLVPNNSNSETNARRIGLDSTGFVQDAYGANREYIYCAIRRPDGYVGKPANAGTDVFNVANYDSTAPAFNANFPVDIGLFKRSQQANSWRLSARLIQETYLETDNNGAASAETDYVFDYNDGWNKQTGYSNTEVSWSWKRHAGFDVVTYKGNGTAGNVINHSLSQSPQMTWIKRRDGTGNWSVWHHGLNNGSSNLNYEVLLNDDIAERNWGNITAMGSTSFTLGGGSATNGNNDDMIAMLFASVNGISKVGSWAGSNSAQTITLGFEPRFLLFKNIDTTNWWELVDTTRGWATSSGGTSKILYPNEPDAQGNDTYIHKTSTGFVLVGNIAGSNQSGSNYIYYAHA